jgi:hypothetical protein
MRTLDQVNRAIAESLRDGRIAHLYPSKDESDEMSETLRAKSRGMELEEGIKKFGGPFWSIWLHLPS